MATYNRTQDLLLLLLSSSWLKKALLAKPSVTLLVRRNFGLELPNEMS